jgi:hypothetical protein
MPEQYLNFYLASVGASAALIGLLFVALSIEAELEKEAKLLRYLLSQNSFIALMGIFLISLLALLGVNPWLFTGATLIFVFTGLGYMFGGRNSTSAKMSDKAYVGLTITTYLALGACAVWIAVTDNIQLAWQVFGFILIIHFALAVTRAWRSLIITKFSR